MKKFTAILLGGLMTLNAGCAEMKEVVNQAGTTVQRGLTDAFDQGRAQNLPPPTLRVDPVAQRQYQSADGAYTKTVVQGAVFGAIIGGVACKYVAKANDTETALCALAVGGIGAAIGNNIAKKNQELIKSRAKVDEALAEAKATRESAAQLLAATDKNVASLQSQVVALKAQRAKNQISQAQYESNMIAARQQAKSLNDSVSKVNDSLTKQRDAIADLEKQASSASNADVKKSVPAIHAQVEAHDGFLKTETAKSVARVKELETAIGA